MPRMPEQIEQEEFEQTDDTEQEEVDETEDTDTEEVDQTDDAEGDTEEGDENDDEGYELPDGRRFKTKAEALKAANDLLLEKDIALARADGYQEAARNFRQQQTPATPPPEDDITEEEFFTDPKSAVKKIEERVTNKIHAQLSEKQRGDQVWAGFSSRHRDLSDFREDVEATYKKFEPQIQAIVQARGIDAGYDYLAQKTRAKFQAYKQASNPKETMDKTKNVKKTGSQQNPSGKSEKDSKEKPVDFSTQWTQLKNKRRGTS